MYYFIRKLFILLIWFGYFNVSVSIFSLVLCVHATRSLSFSFPVCFLCVCGLLLFVVGFTLFIIMVRVWAMSFCCLLSPALSTSLPFACFSFEWSEIKGRYHYQTFHIRYIVCVTVYILPCRYLLTKLIRWTYPWSFYIFIFLQFFFFFWLSKHLYIIFISLFYEKNK